MFDWWMGVRNMANPQCDAQRRVPGARGAAEQRITVGGVLV